MLKPSNLMSKCTVIVLLFLTANTVIGQNINQGQQPDALFTLQDSLTLFKSYNAAASEAIKNLNFDLAVRNISKANKLIASVNSLELKAKSILTNVQLQYHLQNYNQASRLNLDAIKIIHLSKDKSSLAIAYLMQGLIDTKLSNFAKAEKRFKMSDSIYKSKNDEKGKSYILLGRGMLELLRNKPQVAVNYLNAGITQFDEYDMPSDGKPGKWTHRFNLFLGLDINRFGRGTLTLAEIFPEIGTYYSLKYVYISEHSSIVVSVPPIY